jgi:DNA-3-methyladenine glycosylase
MAVAAGRRLGRAFYARDAELVARELIGATLVRDVQGRRRRARIVETEAYLGPHDLASHSSKGQTKRNAAMFGPPGRAYVYVVYGMHHCLNVVTGARGAGAAVLLRAAEPLDGWAARLSGPALLAKAFGVTRKDDRLDLVRGAIAIEVGEPPAKVAADRRIGVGYAGSWSRVHLRFLDPSSTHVSVAAGRHRRASKARRGRGPRHG